MRNKRKSVSSTNIASFSILYSLSFVGLEWVDRLYSRLKQEKKNFTSEEKSYLKNIIFFLPL